MFPATGSCATSRMPCRSEIRPTCCIRSLQGRDGEGRGLEVHTSAQGSQSSFDFVPQLLCCSKICRASVCLPHESGTRQSLVRARHVLLSANSRAVQKPWKRGRTNVLEFTPLLRSSLRQSWHGDTAGANRVKMRQVDVKPTSSSIF